MQQPTLMNSKSTAEVTLNMLNASESEVDVEGLNFDASHEVVTSWIVLIKTFTLTDIYLLIYLGLKLLTRNIEPKWQDLLKFFIMIKCSCNWKKWNGRLPSWSSTHHVIWVYITWVILLAWTTRNGEQVEQNHMIQSKLSAWIVERIIQRSY